MIQVSHAYYTDIPIRLEETWICIFPVCLHPSVSNQQKTKKRHVETMVKQTRTDVVSERLLIPIARLMSNEW